MMECILKWYIKWWIFLLLIRSFQVSLTKYLLIIFCFTVVSIKLIRLYDLALIIERDAKTYSLVGKPICSWFSIFHVRKNISVLLSIKIEIFLCSHKMGIEKHPKNHAFFRLIFHAWTFSYMLFFFFPFYFYQSMLAL